jgi:hypothetical protein
MNGDKKKQRGSHTRKLRPEYRVAHGLSEEVMAVLDFVSACCFGQTAPRARAGTNATSEGRRMGAEELKLYSLAPILLPISRPQVAKHSMPAVLIAAFADGLTAPPQ